MRVWRESRRLDEGCERFRFSGEGEGAVRGG